jgi:hypothetical protein
MFEQRNRDYFSRREAEERAAAQAATATEARAIHLQMAHHYAALGRQLDGLEAGVVNPPPISDGPA